METISPKDDDKSDDDLNEIDTIRIVRETNGNNSNILLLITY